MNKQLKTIAIQWLGPCFILVIVLLAMLVNFSTKSRVNANNTVNRNIISSAENCTNDFYEELTLLEKVGKPVAELISEYIDSKSDKNDMRNVTKLLNVAISNSGACKAYICDENGKAIDNEGKTVSLKERDFYANISGKNETQYLYTFDEEDGTAAVVVSLPVLSDNWKRVRLLMLYPVNNLENIIQKYDFNLWSMETLIDQNGNAVASFGIKDYWKQGDNVYEKLKSKDPALLSAVRSNLNGGVSAIDVMDSSTSLVQVPLGAGKWSVIYGVTQSYIDKQTSLQWSAFKSMLNQLVIVLFIFMLFVIVVNIISWIYNKRKQQQLESKADTDLLTGLNNKLATERKIKEFMIHNPDAQSMMFIFDIDNFKKINDTMGHAFGDEVLRSLGQQIRVIFRASDILGRIGGDEFIVFLKNLPDASAIRKEAKKVEDFFKDFKAGEYTKYAATASIGAAIFPQEGTDFESLYKAADSALYKAKQRGKKQLAFYDEKWVEENAD